LIHSFIPFIHSFIQCRCLSSLISWWKNILHYCHQVTIQCIFNLFNLITKQCALVIRSVKNSRHSTLVHIILYDKDYRSNWSWYRDKDVLCCQLSINCFSASGQCWLRIIMYFRQNNTSDTPDNNPANKPYISSINQQKHIGHMLQANQWCIIIFSAVSVMYEWFQTNIISQKESSRLSDNMPLPLRIVCKSAAT